MTLASTDGYQIDIIVSGFPGKSVCHGPLGWSTIALLRGHGKVALIDVGSFGLRQVLQDGLTAHGLTPADVTDVLLTHSHYDHAVNWVMFPNARVSIGNHELDWALEQPWGTTFVPELYMKELASSAQLKRIDEGVPVLPRVTTFAAPGHTPGHVVYHLEGTEYDVIFCGDAAKNRAELVSRDTDMTYDANVSRASIARIWEHWQAKAGTIVVPGHDLPLTLENGEPTYIGDREAGVKVWAGDDLETTTVFNLAVN